MKDKASSSPRNSNSKVNTTNSKKKGHSGSKVGSPTKNKYYENSSVQSNKYYENAKNYYNRYNGNYYNYGWNYMMSGQQGIPLNYEDFYSLQFY